MARDYLATVVYIGGQAMLAVRATQVRFLKQFLRDARNNGYVQLEVPKPDGFNPDSLMMTLTRQDKQVVFRLVIEEWEDGLLIGYLDARESDVRQSVVTLLNISGADTGTRPRTSPHLRGPSTAASPATAKPAQAPPTSTAKPVATGPSATPAPPATTAPPTSTAASAPTSPTSAATPPVTNPTTRPGGPPVMKKPSGQSRWRIDMKAVSKARSPEDGETSIPAPPVYFSEAAKVKELRTTYKEKSWEELNLVQQPYEYQCPSFVGHDAASISEALKLNPKEQRFVENLITGDLSLLEIYKMTNLSRRETVCFVLAMLGAELITFTERPLEELQKRNLTIATKHRYLAIEGANYFGFLDLHWSANAEEIDAAATAINDQLAPVERGLLTPELQQKASEIFDHLRKARAALASHKDRRAYRLTFLEQFNVDQSVELFATQLEWAVYRADQHAINKLVTRIKELTPHQANAIIKTARSKASRRPPGDSPPDGM